MKGYFRKRGNSWGFTIDIGRDPRTGKRRQKSKSGFKTKKEAQLACAEFITKYEKEGFIEANKTTLSSFTKQFIDSEIKPNKQPSTTNSYNLTLKKLDESIGWMELSNLTALHLHDFIQYLRSFDYKNGTINLYITCLKRVLTTAYEWNLINYDLAKTLKKQKTSKKIEKYWSFDECMSFLSDIKDDPYYLVYLLTIFTGMRRGEVLGLSEKYCDFENNLINVKQQVVADKDTGKVYISEILKTDSSYRIIDVPDDIMKQLKHYILDRKKKFLALGIQQKEDLIFLTQDGNMISPNYLSRRFKEACEKYGYRNITFHGLRHSHATILAELKGNVHAIADRLGHSKISTTNEMYIHLTEKMKSSLTSDLEKLLQSKM